jgi:hypothetical protein
MFHYLPKIRKSYYKNGNKPWGRFLTILVSICEIILVAITFIIHTAAAFILCQLILSTSFIFFTLWKHQRIMNRINQANAEITWYTKKILLRFKIGITLYFVSMIVYFALLIGMYIVNRILLEAWIWFAFQIIIGICDGYYLSSIMAFGKYSYYSGSYAINYNSISQIKIIETMNTSAGEVNLVEFDYHDERVGFDKLFTDEEVGLKNKILNRVY